MAAEPRVDALVGTVLEGAYASRASSARAVWARCTRPCSFASTSAWPSS